MAIFLLSAGVNLSNERQKGKPRELQSKTPFQDSYSDGNGRCKLKEPFKRMFEG